MFPFSSFLKFSFEFSILKASSEFSLFKNRDFNFAENILKYKVSDNNNEFINFSYTFLGYFLLCNGIVPITLVVTLQFIKLIQNGFFMIDDEYKEKLIDSILSNYEIVEKLMLNADEARKKVCMGVFKATFLRIEKELSSSQDLEVIEGNDVDHKYSQIWIKPLKQEDRKLWFVLESFSGKGHLNGNMFIGIFNPAPHDSAYRLHPNKTSISNWIINKRDFSKVNGYSVNLMDAQTIQKIYTDERFKNEFIDHIVKETVTFINQEFPNLKLFLTTGKLPEDHDLVSIG